MCLHILDVFCNKIPTAIATASRALQEHASSLDSKGSC